MMTLVEEAPIACTLNAGDLESRQRWIRIMNTRFLQSYRQEDLQLDLFYAPEARTHVQEMVEGEQSCCTFLTFAVSEEPGTVRVTVNAPESARAAAGPLFEALHAADAGERACACSDTGCGSASGDRSGIATRRVIGGSAAVAAAGALACGVCCVLPFALPAAALAVSGGVLSWFAKATPWVMKIALLAVVCSWAWVTYESVRARQAPARSTYLTLGASTAAFVVAAIWWHFEGAIIRFLR